MAQLGERYVRIIAVAGSIPAGSIHPKPACEVGFALVCLGKFVLYGEGLNIGRGGGAPVTVDYAGDRPEGLLAAQKRARAPQTHPARSSALERSRTSTHAPPGNGCPRRSRRG